MREWLAIEGMNKLPADLASKVIEVKKSTNNNGETREAASVTQTSDKLWLFSAAELCGTVSENEWPWKDATWSAIVYNAEGLEYLLFSDTNVSPFEDNTVLSRSFENKSCEWWERTPAPVTDSDFRVVTNQGMPHNRMTANKTIGVLPGFCI